MRNKRIAITGHTGVIGSEFVARFKNNVILKCDVDISNKKQVYKWIKNNHFEIFIHFAAIVPVNQVDRNKKKAYSVNFLGTKYLVDALLKYKKKNNIFFFFSSTSHVYKPTDKKVNINENFKIRPISFYGNVKSLAEKYIINQLSSTNINFCIGRIFSFTHFKQKEEYFVPMVFKKILNKKEKEISFSRVNTLRDFIHIDDLLNSIKILINKKITGVVNIGSGFSTDLRIIIFKVLKITKSKKNILIENKKNKSNLIADISLLKKLGFKPKFTIDDILKKFYKLKYKSK